MHMLIFGHGYTAAALTPHLVGAGWTVSGTTRNDPPRVAGTGASPILWPGEETRLRAELARADAILISVAPDRHASQSRVPPDISRADESDPIRPLHDSRTQAGPAEDPISDTLRAAAPPDDRADAVIADFATDLLAAHPRWVGYLSSTNVYGDHGGAWVDEMTPPNPGSPRAVARLRAEKAWAGLARNAGWPLTIFRLAGIYGPGRGPFAKLRSGTARRIVKPGQVFSRIHVEDIAGALMASLGKEFVHPRSAMQGLAHVPDVPPAGVWPRPSPSAPDIYNICDDDPAPPEQVIELAAELLGLPVPPAEDFTHARMTPMARSFYADSKRVRNDRMKRHLGYRLLYPDHRSGLAALLAAERCESS